jgi:hypothetical protein
MQPFGQETFDALRRVAASAPWPRYAAFAALQEKGLRKQALEEVRAFSTELTASSLDVRWRFVSWVLGNVTGAGGVVETLIPFPLKVDVVLPALREKRAQHPPCPEAYLWTADYFTADLVKECSGTADPRGDLLREGVARIPCDGRLKTALADHLLGLVEYNQHHLVESSYLGDPDLDLERLEEALGLLDGPSDDVRSDIARAQELARAWRAFRDAGASDFSAWCRDHGMPPPTGIAIVYE